LFQNVSTYMQDYTSHARKHTDTEDSNLHHRCHQNPKYHPKFTLNTLFHYTSNCNITNASLQHFNYQLSHTTLKNV